VPDWNTLLGEVKQAGNVHDVTRRKYLARLGEYTNRNTILYYSGWLQKGALAAQWPEPFSVNDNDKNGFMAMIHGLDRSKGLDLLLHTPGGDVAAAESLVGYLRSMFGTNIRAIVPQLAMSAGTMIACGCREIVMGAHSSLGPIDPQLNGLPAHGIVEEFQQASRDIAKNPATIPLWQPIIAKYHPTLIGECQKAIKWAADITVEWLKTGMFSDATTDSERGAKAMKVVTELGDHALTLSHSRHIDKTKAQDLGLRVTSLEADQELQDAVLAVHHICMQTLSETAAVKLIENHNGMAFIQVAGQPIQIHGGGPGTF
jgi:membrane-bound ClpP family serine protease